ncbi:MAG: HAD-IB family hydrolase [Synergistaceae bacterium]|jgi:HAD superfamily hydrolase (TIGR01490 family)|nr:HAD-IB family hydrolase [Synergistaceae bacterium]
MLTGSAVKEKRIALFDFDGTLTRKDTFLDFHVKRFGAVSLVAAMFKAALACPLSKLTDRSEVKERFVSRMWKGTLFESYLSCAEDYAEREIDGITMPTAMEVFRKHLELGDTVCIVTASMKDWVEPWASRYGVPVVGTELEVEDGRITGRLKTPNCRGAEKVSRVKAKFDLNGFSKIFAYGNSGGDREMLALADEAVYKWRRAPRL